MDKYDKQKVVINYYKAAYALSEISTTKSIPDELLQLSLDASRETAKIIDYINKRKLED